MTNFFVIILLIATVVHYWPRDARLQALIGEQYPAEAVSYLQAHPPSGRVLNFYLWGGYLNLRDPSVKVFLDSRVDIFEYSGVLKDYLDLLGLNDAALLLDKYKIRYVLFPRGEPLTYVLQHDSKWKVLYSDKLSILLEKNGNGLAVDAARASSTVSGRTALSTTGATAR